MGFSKEHFAMSLTNHPVASKIPQLPQAQDRVVIQNGPYVLHGFGRPENAPMSIEDYLSTDRPLLHLHTITFTDATLVSYSLSHCSMDALAMQAFYTSWSLVLQGKEQEVPPNLSFQADFLKNVLDAARPSEPWILEQLQRRLLSKSLVDGKPIPPPPVTQPSQDTRTMFIPASLVARLRLSIADTTDAPVSFSDGDVLLAWLVKTLCQALPDDDKDVIVANKVDLRNRLSVRNLPLESRHA